MTLYARLQKRHRFKEQSVGLCGRRRGWDDLREKHWNKYIIICEIDRQSRFDSWVKVLRAGALGWPWGMGWEGRWEGGSGWGEHMYIHGWFMWIYGKNHHNIVISFQLKFKKISRIFCRVLYWAKYLIENWRISNKTPVPFSNEQGEKRGPQALKNSFSIS